MLHARAFGLQPIDQVYVRPGCVPSGALLLLLAAHAPQPAACRACAAEDDVLSRYAAPVHPGAPCSAQPIIDFHPSDTHWMQIDYKNSHGLQAEALEGRTIGMAGKQIIHPSQIAPVQASWGERAAGMCIVANVLCGPSGELRRQAASHAA